ARMIGGWQKVSILLLLGHFIIPFVLFISKHPKRFPATAAIIAVWMVLMHMLDMYWLVLPEIPSPEMWNAAGESYVTLQALADQAMTSPDASPYGYTGFAPHLLDLTCLLALGGLYTYATIKRLGSAALYPLKDPRLHESLAFENM
ncbi:MAG: hypothetical protein KC983_12345, partial [Phycisphaerales bacterium]|nr:hypothetical protein [Phycisphaerales bacterium]